MAKQVIFNKKARDEIKKGMDVVAKAVGVTIGPFGRNVAIGSKYGAPTITNDGVSIAREISLKNGFENMGAEILKEVANKTNELAGDGTSTSIVLTNSIIGEGMKAINEKVNVIALKKGIELAGNKALDELSKMKRELSNDNELVRAAVISSENEEYGKIIAETIKKVGKDGVVTVDESQSFGIESEVVEGLEIDKGYISPYMMTNSERLEAEYKDVPVLVTDKKLTSVKEILPLLEKLAQAGSKDLVIIAEDIEGEALTTFVLNKLRGTFNVLGIKSPGFGDGKKESLGDIATVVGARLVSSDLGLSFDNIDLNVLGRASRIVSKKDKTVIVGTTETKPAVESRIKNLKGQLDSLDSKFDKERLESRIAKLSGGVAVIKVGAATESEMKYLKLKLEDAVNATKSALDEGIVVGGGAALVHVANAIQNSFEEVIKEDKSILVKEFNSSTKLGYDILVSALSSPMTKIVENTLGVNKVKSVLAKVQSMGSVAGYNALTQEYVEDMFKAGVIDPFKVTKTALLNAISTSGIFLTTEAAVVDLPEKEEGGEGNF